MLSDKQIISWYMQGFNDELYGTTSTIEDDVALNAYKLGALHAIVGDDVRGVDYLSELLADKNNFYSLVLITKTNLSLPLFLFPLPDEQGIGV